MKFVIDFVTKHSGRIGTLTKGDIDIKTPLVLHYTKVIISSLPFRMGAGIFIHFFCLKFMQVGSVPHISREVFDLLTTEQQGIQVSVETTSALADAVNQFQKGIAAFAALDHTFSFVTLKDSGTVNTSPQHSRNSVEIATRAGKTSITPQKYIEIVESFKPDIFHALCDGDTNETSAIKRIFNAVTRTDTFFKECAELYKQSTILTDTMFIGKKKKTEIMKICLAKKKRLKFKCFISFYFIYFFSAPIEGGYNEDYRQRSIKLLNDFKNQEMIGGYFLDGFHSNGETAKKLDALKVCEIVEKCVVQLPANKLKIMLGAYSPALVIQLIQLGVDVFDTTYAYLAASINQALTFTFDVNHCANDQNSSFAIDLSDPM